MKKYRIIQKDNEALDALKRLKERKERKKEKPIVVWESDKDIMN